MRDDRRLPGMLESTTGEWGLIEVSGSRVPLAGQPDSIRGMLAFIDRDFQDVDREELTEAEK